jgi:mannitol/fructose-specific phosphotransferase system IIA component (Ntr-type)
VKIQDIIQKNAILPDLKAIDKTDLLKQMAYYLASLYTLKDPAMITQRILDREAEMTTGIGFGIAIPHARIEGIEKVYMIVGRCINGIEFAAIDENPVQILFMLISPKNTSEEHTKILSSLSKIMSVSDIRQRMIEAASVDEFLAVLTEGENKYAH